MKYRVFLDLVEKATGVRPTHSFISAKLGGKPKAGALGNRYFCDGNISDQELLVLIPHFPTVDFSPYLNINISNLNTNLISNFDSKETNQKSDVFAIPYWEGCCECAERLKRDDFSDLKLDIELIKSWNVKPEDLRIIAMPGEEMNGGEMPIANKDLLVIDINRNNPYESGVFFVTSHNCQRVYVRRLMETLDDEGESVVFSTVDNELYKKAIEKFWTKKMKKEADIRVIGRVITNATYTI